MLTPVRRRSYANMAPTGVVLGVDPGEVTMFVCALAYDSRYFGSTDSISLRGVGPFDPAYTIRNLTPAARVEGKTRRRILPALPAGHAAFCKRFSGIVRRVKATSLIYERFMARGVQTKAAETVNFMAGTMATLALKTHSMHVRCFPASEWKAAVNRTHDLESIYENFKGALPPHAVDCIGIGLYGILNSHGYVFDSHLFEGLLTEACEQAGLGLEM